MNAGPKETKRIIVPIVAGIGNALMAQPMIRALNRHIPAAKLTVVARTSAMADVFVRNQEVHEIHVSGNSMVRMWQLLRSIRRDKPDIFLIPFPSNRWQYRALAMSSGARDCIMHAYPVGKWRAWGFLGAKRVPSEKGIHDVIQNLNLLKALDIEQVQSQAPRFEPNEQERNEAKSLIKESQLPKSPQPLAVHPGSARTVLAEYKRCPEQSYAKLVGELQSRFDRPIVILDGPDERGLATRIGLDTQNDQIKVLKLESSLGVAAAVLEMAHLYVGQDSGLAHLAAAVGTRAVTLFGPTDPDRVCPYGNRQWVVQPNQPGSSPSALYPFESTYPKFRHSNAMDIKKINVNQVLEMVDDAMKDYPAD